MRRLQALFHSCSLRRARLPLRKTSCCRLAVESSDAVETHAAISSLPGTSMPRFFRRSKNQHRTFKAGNPAGDAFRLISSHAVVIKSVWASRPKHTDQLWAEHRAMLDAHRIHDAAVRIHTDKKIPFADKISQCVCHTRTPSMLSIAKSHMRHAALSRALPSTLIIPESSKFLQAFL